MIVVSWENLRIFTIMVLFAMMSDYSFTNIESHQHDEIDEQ